ncbi:hypothetical protein N9948_01165 [bacterium]|nr:hypothetical protein [bacterium]
MSDSVTRIIKAYLEDKKSSSEKEGFSQQDRTPSPYVVPHTQMMEQFPYYTDQEVTDVHLQIDSPHGEEGNKELQDKKDKKMQYPEQEWQNVDWGGAGGAGGGAGDFLAPYENPIQKEFNRTPNSPQNLYDPLRGASSKDIYDLNTGTSSSIDGFLGHKKYVKVSNMDLNQFMKVSDDTLIHKSNKDLWQMVKDKEGNVFISRLFDEEFLGEQ